MSKQKQTPIAIASAVLLIGALIGASSCGLKQTTEPQAESSGALNQINVKPEESTSRPAPKVSAHKPAKIGESRANLASAEPSSPRLKLSAPIAKPDANQASTEGRSANKTSHDKALMPPPIMAKRKPLPSATAPMRRLSPGYQPPYANNPLAVDRERYQHYQDNPIKLASEEPVSTFSIDVDTGSYTNTRRMLKYGQLPVSDAVRAEEFINYFNYDYPSPDDDRAFAFSTEIGPSPWNDNAYLLHLGIQGKRIAVEQLPPANLVFLIDVSGSMQSPDKLALLVKGLKLLTGQLRKQDRVAIVVYAGASGLVLDSTSGHDKHKIINALDQLRAGGSTNGASGIRLAYQTARAAFIKNGSNRIILATDGDFNVGTVNFHALLDMVKRERQSGIELTTLGFGSGNYNDKLLEQLADAGNGNYAYIDSLMEAQKALVEQLGATLHTIAKDVKIQIEFNPKVVREYRLIGYENRKLRREDFNNDKVDAGEIGAGHSVTALYEIVLQGSKGSRIDELRYGEHVAANDISGKEELAFLKLRYKKPKNDTSELVSQAIAVDSIKRSLQQTSNNFRFAASVAAFAQLLRGGTYVSDGNKDFTLADVVALAQHAKGEDSNGYRSEYIRLVNLSRSLMPSLASLR